MMFSLFIVCAIIFLYWRRFTFWSRQGIKGPAYIDFQMFTKQHHKYIMEKHRKYGRVYGGYEIIGKYLIVNEPSLIKEIFVRNFDVFPQHKLINVSQSPKLDNMLFFMPGNDRWKRVRSIITPAFTSGKLKAMMSQISDITDNFVTHLETFEKTGEVIDIRNYMASFVIDVITSCAFGIRIDSIKNPKHPIVLYAKKVLSVNATMSMMLSIFAPSIAKFLKLEFIDKRVSDYFIELATQILEQRKQLSKLVNQENVKKRTDFIQLMLDSEKDLEYDSNGDETDQNKTAGKLTADEITCQSIHMLTAGYDTSSAALSHLVYYLGQNKDCQQRLYEELKEVMEFSYEKLSELKYLNAVIDETLRLSPSILRIQRQCERDFDFNGIKIPKGSTIDVLPYVIHRDPEFWPEPELFKPERFLEPTHHPWTYLPFGGGPRGCVAQRFALNEIRMCAAKLFNKFELTVSPGFKLEYYRGSIMFGPKSVLVNLKARN